MKKLNITDIIERVNKYSDYSVVLNKENYKNGKVLLYCNKINNDCEHGEFWATIGHLKEGHGCPKCGSIRRIKKNSGTTEQFIERAKEIHGDKYDYSKVEYKGCNKKVCIICPEHGEFWQTPHSHLNGRGCPNCALVNHPHRKYTINEFIKKAKQVHGDKYDYSKVKYVNSQIKVCIICPEHGEFWQTPAEHLRKCGCPFCKETHLEYDIRKLLVSNNIKFMYDVRDILWLKPLTLDFYLPDYNIAIECQGEQHFKPIEYFGGEKEFVKLKERDKIKKDKCFEQNVKLIYYSSYKYNENIITDLKQILNEIK